ncbi:dimethyl sulfoxide reductase anchor subunit family protein [Marilutibacter alkalisoli]|uniref:Dimethyl sulfoxide reductase anchor subunit n=1 Tax=Marilutibacter alkalisoli TaxID=2591633 RepID=A0A514BV35_9GAMM|nr:DmsC/YnfH family molybdoenzyme membrane anchor subunit [Lysobacter alkalisoli]QDH71227.1 dimethyl sulfoxide reductase anchor subunit [Lysobacter alkalisoli]
MNPALSVIFFTTLSGAGYGLLAWTAAWILLPYLQGHPPQQGAMPLLWGISLVLGLLLTTAGLLCSMFHLGKPARAWRAFSQWRSSWLSREGVSAVLAAIAALALLGLLATPLFMHSYAALQSPAVPLLAAIVLLTSVATIACTAMIYASLKPIPAWRHALVVPVYFAFALLCGWLLLAAIASWTALPVRTLAIAAVVTWVLAIVTAMLKRVYWRAIDRQPAAASRADAIGLPGREIGVFERPHTEANYITHEMGYVLARKHSRPLRLIATYLFALVPMLAVGLGWAFPALDAPLFTLAAMAALLGVFVERWLFFAQARHAVMAYY